MEFPLIKILWRKLLYWRFVVFQRHRHNRLVLEQVGGYPILVLPGVFNPKLFWSSELLVDQLNSEVIFPGATVLDLGSGSGVAAVVAAKWAKRIIATDINPTAVRCATINALLNGVDGKVRVREGDLFEPVKNDAFDLVLFNPPYFGGVPQSALDFAWKGERIIERFAAGLPNMLKPGGSALVVLSSNAHEVNLNSMLAKSDLRAENVEQKKMITETLSVFRISPQFPAETVSKESAIEIAEPDS